MTVDVPCNIGDAVWGIRQFKGILYPQQGFVGDIFFTKDMRLMILVKYVCRGEWGKKVFATQSECEAAIAAMK